MHVFHFKLYISAVFSLIAMNFTPYSPTVPWCMCAAFAAFLIEGTRAFHVGVLVEVKSLHSVLKV